MRLGTWMIAVIAAGGCSAHYRIPLEEMKALDGFDAHNEHQVQTTVQVGMGSNTATALVTDPPIILHSVRGAELIFNSETPLRFELKNGNATPTTTWSRITLNQNELVAEPNSTIIPPVRVPASALSGSRVEHYSPGRTSALLGIIGIAGGTAALLAANPWEWRRTISSGSS